MEESAEILIRKIEQSSIIDALLRLYWQNTVYIYTVYCEEGLAMHLNMGTIMREEFRKNQFNIAVFSFSSD